MERNFIHAGEGYFVNPKNPSEGCYGISPEIDKQREEEWEENLHLEKAREKSRIVKALGLLKEIGSRDSLYKANFLKKLGYNEIYVSGKKIKLLDAVANYPHNLTRMYERTITELRDIVNNPEKKSKLTERLDSLQ